MSQRTSRKFLPVIDFQPQFEGDYHLLPFRFHVMDKTREVLVSEVGDYLVVPRGTAERLATHKLPFDDPLFPDLLARFFVSEVPLTPMADVIATRLRTKKGFLERDTLLHIFVPTLRCNHTCQYCQVSRQSEDHLEFNMKPEDMEAALDLAFQSRARNMTIEFQGGEPLLAFDRVRQGVEGALARNSSGERHLTFVICTNLSLLDDSVLKYCREHDILLSSSLDGPPDVHNENRRLSRSDSYEAFVNGLDLARAALGQSRVSALMTTTRASLDHPEEIVDAYVENGFDHIFLRDINPYGFAVRGRGHNDHSVEEFLAFFKRALDYIISLNKSGTRLAEVYSSIILRKILTPFNDGFVDLQSPAGVVNSVVLYNYDGGVYCSDESRMLAETGDQTFRLGSVHDRYEDLFMGPAVEGIAETWANEALAGCSECAFQTYCGADPVRNWATQGDMAGYRPTSAFCTKNMEIIRHLLQLMADDSEVEGIFRDWIQ